MQSNQDNFSNKHRILICGGHLAPALSVIENLRKQGNFSIYFFGRKHTFEGDKALSLEYKTIHKYKIAFYNITTGRLQRKFSLEVIKSLLKFPLGFIQSYKFIRKVKPDIILSFGGYIALPVCLAGYLKRIPIITHEQTSIMGLTNRIISLFASKICLSFNTTKYAPKNNPNVIITGNPMRESIKHPLFEKNKNNWEETLPLIMVLGGSSGSHVINQVMSKLIIHLVKQYRVLHQCGNAYNGMDFNNLWSIKNSLPVRLKRNYLILKHIDTQELGYFYKKSSLIIGRSGANTVLEIAYHKKPAILIPLSLSAEGEQTENARLLKDLGATIVINQSDLTPKILLAKINDMVANIDYYNKKANIAYKSFTYNGHEKILSVISSILKANY